MRSMISFEELQEVFNTLCESDQQLLKAVEREMVVSYDSNYVVGGSITYATSKSVDTIGSCFDFAYNLVGLPEVLRRTLDVLVGYANLGAGYCFAPLGSIAARLGISKWAANRYVRKLGEIGFTVVCKEPCVQNPDPKNTYHWRLKSYLHPVLLNEQRFIEELLARYDEIKLGQQFQWQGEKRSEIIENLFAQGVTVLPTVEGEKRPLYSLEEWNSLSTAQQKTVLNQSHTDLIIRVPAGITVLDFDSNDKLTAFKNRYPQQTEVLHSTFAVKTPRGFHFWFRSNNSLASNNQELFDIRSTGSWLVIPSGQADREVVQYETLENLPDGINFSQFKRFTANADMEPPTSSGGSILTGNRNNTLFRIGRSIRRSYASLQAFAAEMLRQAYQCKDMLPKHELESLIRNCWSLPNRPEFV